MHQRFWEIDFARGVAVAMMIVFHVLFDLSYFAGYAINISGGFLWWFARATAAVFIFLVGVGLSISHARTLESGFDAFVKKIVSRGLKTLALAFVITAATFALFSNRGTIWFGVLHFIGVGVIASLLFVSNALLAFSAGVFSLALGFALDNVVVDTPYLVWLGLKFPGFYTFDYFPVFPWFGVMLLGVAVGKKLYEGGKRRFALPELSVFAPIKFVSFVGRHSLFIYFLHQPVLVALILLLNSLA